MHGEIENRLEASGMAYTHLRAGEFNAGLFSPVPPIVAKGAMFLPMEDARIASIDVGDSPKSGPRADRFPDMKARPIPHRSGGADP